MGLTEEEIKKLKERGFDNEQIEALKEIESVIRNMANDEGVDLGDEDVLKQMVIPVVDAMLDTVDAGFDEKTATETVKAKEELGAIKSALSMQGRFTTPSPRKPTVLTVGGIGDIYLYIERYSE